MRKNQKIWKNQKSEKNQKIWKKSKNQEKIKTEKKIWKSEENQKIWKKNQKIKKSKISYTSFQVIYPSDFYSLYIVKKIYIKKRRLIWGWAKELPFFASDMTNHNPSPKLYEKKLYEC